MCMRSDAVDRCSDFKLWHSDESEHSETGRDGEREKERERERERERESAI